MIEQNAASLPGRGVFSFGQAALKPLPPAVTFETNIDPVGKHYGKLADGLNEDD